MKHPTCQLLVILALVTAPIAVSAQGRRRPTPPPTIPAQLMPPAGKCRIWMANVAPAQQPAPTDCQTALRQKPSNGTVIFGPTPRARATARFEAKPAPRADTRARTTKVPPRDSVRRDTVPAATRGRAPRTPPRTPERP